MRLLMFEGLGDRLLIVPGPAPGVRRLIAPEPRLTVELLERRERPGREEAIADVADGPLDASLSESCQLPSMAVMRCVFSG